MKKSLCALFGITMLLSVSPAARSEDNYGRLLSQKPAVPAPAVAPQVKSINPTEVGEGERLTITGTGFSTTPKDNTVTIGDKTLQILQSTATNISAMLPRDAKAGKQKLTV